MKIKTAEEFIRENEDYYMELDESSYLFDALRDFAKYHVKACKKDILENAKIELSKDWIRKEETIKPGSLIAPITIKINEKSIIDGYPLTNIK